MTETPLAEVMNGAAQPDGGGGTQGSIPLPKRNAPRGLLPGTWLGRSACVAYVDVHGVGVETSATLLDWCGLGVVLNLAGDRTILPWESLRAVSLLED